MSRHTLRVWVVLIGLFLFLVGCDRPLPDPMQAGGAPYTAETVGQHRRELKKSLCDWYYGQIPEDRGTITVSDCRKTSLPELNAETEELTLTFGKDLQMPLRITVPRGKGPFPVILRLDYLCGWEYRAPIEEEMLKAGKYAFVTVERRLLAPDDAENREVYGLTAYADEDMGAIGLWAYGAIAAMDYIETLPFLDSKRVCITGHSRDGKAAVAAAALDERFALVSINGAGMGGSACFNDPRKGSETAADLAKKFPHWFTERFNRSAAENQELPVDMIDAFFLIAPRPVLRTEAAEDLWGNPKGSFRTLQAVDGVYDFYGVEKTANGMWLRDGSHGYTKEDWDRLAEFCDLHFYKIPCNSDFRTVWYER